MKILLYIRNNIIKRIGTVSLISYRTQEVGQENVGIITGWDNQQGYRIGVFFKTFSNFFFLQCFCMGSCGVKKMNAFAPLINVRIVCYHIEILFTIYTVIK